MERAHTGDVMVRILEPGDEPLMESFLLPRVESSMFLLGNSRAAGLLDDDQVYQGTYAALFEGDEIIGVVAHYWNGSLVFQAPRSLNRLWQAAIQASGRPIGGLIGPQAQVAEAESALGSRIANSAIQLDESEGLFCLDLDELIVPANLSTGRVVGRRIEPRDLELVTAWRVAYNIEAIGATESPELWEESRTSMERSLREGRTWILEEEGEPVASTSFNTAIQEAVQVGGVWTPPPLRRRGYGRCVVAASLLDARSEGVEKAILFTGEKNIAAQRAYTALGFRHIGDYRLMIFRPPLEIL
jgi:RimJ/RimL family protein N-acetyltransferase